MKQHKENSMGQWRDKLFGRTIVGVLIGILLFGIGVLIMEVGASNNIDVIDAHAQEIANAKSIAERIIGKGA